MAWKEDHECIGKVLCGVCWVKAGRKSSNPMVKFLGMEVNPVWHQVVNDIGVVVGLFWMTMGWVSGEATLVYLGCAMTLFHGANNIWGWRHYRRWWREQRKGEG